MKVKEKNEKPCLKLNIQKQRSWHSGGSLHTNIRGKMETVTVSVFLGSKMTVNDDCSHWIKRCSLLGKKIYDKPKQCKEQRHHFADQSPYIQSYCFFSSHIWTKELDHKGDWQNLMLEKTLESTFDSKKIKPINPKGNPPWIFIERTDPEIESPIFWPSDVTSWLIGKDLGAGKDWG